MFIYKGSKKSVANWVIGNEIPQVLYRNPTEIPQRSHSNTLPYKKNLFNILPGGGTEGGHTRGVFIWDYIGFIPAAVIIGLRRPYPPCLSFSFFCVRVFLVFPPRHCHSLRFLFLFFLVFLFLSFLL